MTIKELAIKYDLPYQTVANRLKRKLGIKGNITLTSEIDNLLKKPKAREGGSGRPRKISGKVVKAWTTPREKNARVSRESKRFIANILDGGDKKHSEFGMNWEDIGAKIGKSRTGAMNIFRSAMGKILDAVKDIQESPEVKAQVFLEVLRETYKEEKQ